MVIDKLFATFCHDGPHVGLIVSRANKQKTLTAKITIVLI